MIYKVIRGVLQQHSGQVDRTGAKQIYKESGKLGEITVWHKAETLETSLEVQMLSLKVFIYSQNFAELAESVSYVRDLGFLQGFKLEARTPVTPL